MKTRPFLLLLLVWAGLAAGAEAPIRVGGYENAPKIHRGRAGEASGFWGELLQHIALAEGWTLEYRWGTWAEGLERLTKGEIDILPDVAVTEERAGRFLFADDPTLRSWSCLYLRSGEAGFESIHSLEGRVVAALRGSVNLDGPGGLRELLQQYGVASRILEVEDYPTAFRAVQEGRAFAAVTNRTFGQLHAARFGLERTPLLFQPVTIRFAFRRDSPEAARLGRAIDARMAVLRNDPTSAYYQLLVKYFETPHAITEVIPAWMSTALRTTGAAALYLLLVMIGSRIQVRRQQSALVRSGHQLAASERRYQEIFHASSDGILVLDAASGRVLDANRRALDFLGLEDPEALARQEDPLTTFGEGPRSQFRDNLRLAAAGQPRTLAIQGPRQGWHERWYEVQLGAAAIEESDRILVTMRDVTESKYAEDLERRLQQTSKLEALGNLATGVVHDFNTLLAVIVGHAELAREEDGSEERREHLAAILAAAGQAGGLARQILLFSRHEPVRAVPIQPLPVLHEVLEMMRRVVPAGIRLHVDLPAGTHEVVVDPIQLKQVLMNLCTNAFHAMEATGGDLHVSVAEVVVEDSPVLLAEDVAPGRFLELLVRDTGPGIPAAIRGRIFEPYFTTKEKGKGTGMGLATVHGIVRQAGGFILVESEPGRGATFRVCLPVEDGSPAEVAPEAPRLDVPRPVARPHRILLVDDEPALLAVGARILAGLGCQVRTAGDVAEALGVLQDSGQELDLVVTDLSMPDGSGLDVVRAARALRPAISSVLCSGRLTPEVAQEARGLGVSRTAIKPLRRSDYLALLEEEGSSPPSAAEA